MGDAFDEEEDGLAEPPEQPAAGVPAGRAPLRELVVAALAIAMVAGAIVFVQWVRGRDREAPSAASFVPGSFSPIGLGPQGGGAPSLGQASPGFQLVDPDGRVVRLNDFVGKPVVVNFWATWCVPCRKEAPDLVALQQEWGDAVQLLGVDYYESAEAVQEFRANFSINYPLLLDSDGRVTGSYKLTGLPETFFLDAQGVIRDHRIGQLRPDVARCIVAGIQAGNHKPEACR